MSQSFELPSSKIQLVNMIKTLEDISVSRDSFPVLKRVSRKVSILEKIGW